MNLYEYREYFVKFEKYMIQNIFNLSSSHFEMTPLIHNLDSEYICH